MLVVSGAQQLAELGRRLKAAGEEGKGLRKQLRKAIREAARPALADAKRAVRAIPIRGEPRTVSYRGGGFAQRQAWRPRKRPSGLRGRIASAMGVSYRDGPKTASVRLRVNPSALPPSQRTLPRHLDSLKGWRHPLFGDTTRWYHQHGRPYWYVTLRRHGPAVRREILQAMDDITRKITKG